MGNKQAGFILLGASVNLLVVTMLIAMVLGYFTNSIVLQNKIREQERAAFLATNYLVTGNSADEVFILREQRQNVDAWLSKREINIYKNNKLVFTTVVLVGKGA